MAKEKKKKGKLPTWARVLIIATAVTIAVPWGLAIREVSYAALKSKKQMNALDYAAAIGKVAWGFTQVGTGTLGDILHLTDGNSGKTAYKRNVKANIDKIAGQVSNNSSYKKTVTSAARNALGSLSKSQQEDVIYDFMVNQKGLKLSRSQAIKQYYAFGGAKGMVATEGDARKIKASMSKVLGSQSSATQKLNRQLTNARRKQQVNNKGATTTTKNDSLVAAQQYYDDIWNAYSKLSSAKKKLVAKKMKEKGYSSVTRQTLQNGEKLTSKKNKAVAKYYKALYSAASKYMSAADKEKISKSAKEANDTDIAQKAEEASEPTTFWGKVGKALINAFWASAIGKWLKENSAGAVIFAGATSESQLESILASNPMQSIYSDSNSTSMSQIASALMPAMIAAGVAFMVLAVIVNATKMGVGTVLDPVRSRLQWYHSMVDLAIAAVGLVGYVALINTILDFNNGLLLAFGKFMNSMTTLGSNSNLFSTALTLGFNDSVATAITKGTILGESFAGVIFCIIYLFAYLGLAVYVKYYYLLRAIVFTILIGVGPIFIALWTTNWGKSRTFNWLHDMLGTVFIQNIHALTLTFMALFMDWNNQRIVGAIGTSASSHASAFGGMVFGFIIMIIFQPVSKSLATLFGISTMMLDNTFQSTSRVMQTAGMVAGGALIGAAKVGAHTAGGLGSAAKAGLKASDKAAESGASKRMQAKAAMGAFKNSAKKNKLGIKAMAGVNGVVGTSVGQLAGLAAGAGAGSSLAALALSKKGGEVGNRAGGLTSRSLNSLGLKMAKKKAAKRNKANEAKRRGAMTDMVNKKVDSALAKDEERKIAADQSAGSDADREHVEDSIKQLEKQAGEENSAEKREKLRALKEAATSKEHIRDMVKDKDTAAKLASTHAATKQDGVYVKSQRIQDVTKTALAGDADAMKVISASSGKGQGNEMEKSLVLGGAAAPGTKVSSISAADVTKARQDATKQYAQAFGDNAKNLAVAKEQAIMHGHVNKDGSANVASWLSSADYQNGLQHAVKTAEVQAAGKSLGEVTSMSKPVSGDALQAFNESAVDSNVYAKDIHNKLVAANVSDATIARFDNEMAKLKDTEGESLIQTTKVPGSDAVVKNVNKELYGQLAKQTSATLNGTLGADVDPSSKFSAADFEAMYTAGYNPSEVMGSTDKFNADKFNEFLNNTDRSEALTNRDAFIDKTQSEALISAVNRSAGAVTDQLNPTKYGFGGGSGFGNNPDVGDGIFGGDAIRNGVLGVSADPSTDAYKKIYENVPQSIASYDMANMTDKTPSISEEIGRIQAYADNEKLSGIPDGSFQMVTTNGGSYIMANDPDYGWVQVGQFGQGDIALGPGESIVQDLSYSSDSNTIGPAFDPNTKRVSQPYSMVDGIKVPRSYSQGSQPDLSKMLQNYGRNYFSTQTDMSDFNQMGTSQRALELSDKGTLSVDKLTAGESGYDSFKYYSDGATQTIVGHRRNAPEGMYENLIPDYSNGSLVNSAMSGVQYSIDLTPTGNGLGVTDNPNVNIYSQNGQLSDQQRKGLLDQINNTLSGSRGRQDFANKLNDIIPQTEEVAQNRLTKNTPNKDVNQLNIRNKD